MEHGICLDICIRVSTHLPKDGDMDEGSFFKVSALDGVDSGSREYEGSSFDDSGLEAQESEASFKNRA